MQTAIRPTAVLTALALGLLAAVLGLLAAAPRAGAAPAPKEAPAAFTREAVVNGPPAEVWRLLTTERGIESWLVPHAEVDLRVGGLVRTHQDRNGRIGDPGTVVNRIVALRPGRMFAISVDQAPEGLPWAGAVVGTRYDVFLDPVSKGKTRVRCIGRDFPGGPMGYAMRSIFDRGAVMALEQLGKAAVKQATKM